MRADGSESVRSAANTRRLILCRMVERLATFFGIMTAYPCASFDTTMEKFGEESRRPPFKTMGNSALGSRFLDGNTRFYTARRVRPERRRPCIILRPELVLDRKRNP